jgi:hypothetical protein
MMESPDEARSEDEIERRRDAALLRALSTPHKKQSEMKIGGRLSKKRRRRTTPPPDAT